MYVDWTCINVNRKDVHASMISFNGKYFKNMGACHGFEKNETATMFFLKKPSLVNIIFNNLIIFEPLFYFIVSFHCNIVL